MREELGTLATVSRSGRPVGLHKRSTDTGAARGLLEEMLGRTARGDQAAFGAVYDAMKSPVFGTVVRIVRDPAQSEEVTQEVFIDVWRHAARFDPEVGSARTWIMTMAHRRAVDRVRRAEAAGERERRAATRTTTRALLIPSGSVTPSDNTLFSNRARASGSSCGKASVSNDSLPDPHSLSTAGGTRWSAPA